MIGPLYHGTDADFTTFQTGRSLHFSDSPAVARRYAGPKGRVIQVHLKMNKPLDLREKGHSDDYPYLDSNDLHDPEKLHEDHADELHSHGFDGIIAKHEYSMGFPDGTTEYVVFHPHQVVRS